MTDSPSASSQQLLAAARTVQQVVAVSNDFLDRVDARTALELPAPCRPRPMRSGVDISEYAYDLKRWTHAASGPARDTVEHLAVFFTEAAHRLTFLTGPHRVDPSTIDWTVVAQWEARD